MTGEITTEMSMSIQGIIYAQYEVILFTTGPLVVRAWFVYVCLVFESKANPREVT